MPIFLIYTHRNFFQIHVYVCLVFCAFLFLEFNNEEADDSQLKSDLPSSVYNIDRNSFMQKIVSAKKRAEKHEKFDLTEYSDFNESLRVTKLKQWRPELSFRKQWVKMRKQKIGLLPRDFLEEES